MILDIINQVCEKFISAEPDQKKQEKMRKQAKEFEEKKNKKKKPDPEEQNREELAKLVEGWGKSSDEIKAMIESGKGVMKIINEMLDEEDERLEKIRLEKERLAAEAEAEEQFQQALKRQASLALAHKTFHDDISNFKDTHVEKEILLKDAEKDLSNIEFDIDVQEKSVNSLEKSLNDFTRKIEDRNAIFNKTIEEKKPIQEDLEQRISKLEVKILDDQKKVKDANSTLTESEKELIRKNIEDAKKEQLKLREQLAPIDSSIKEAKEGLGLNSALLEKTIKKIKEKLDGEMAELVALKKSHTDLSSSIGTLRADVETSSVELEAKKQEMGKILAEKKELDEKVGNGLGAKETSVLILEGEQKDIEIAIKANDGELKNVGKNIEKYEKNIQVFEKQLQDAKTTGQEEFLLQTIEQKIQQMRDKAGDLRNEEMALQKKGVGLGAELEAKKAEVTAVKEEVEALKKDNPTLSIAHEQRKKAAKDDQDKKDAAATISIPGATPVAAPEEGKSQKLSSKDKPVKPNKEYVGVNDLGNGTSTDKFEQWLMNLMGLLNMIAGKLVGGGLLRGTLKMTVGALGVAKDTIKMGVMGIPAKIGGPGSWADRKYDEYKESRNENAKYFVDAAKKPGLILGAAKLGLGAVAAVGAGLATVGVAPVALVSAGIGKALGKPSDSKFFSSWNAMEACGNATLASTKVAGSGLHDTTVGVVKYVGKTIGEYKWVVEKDDKSTAKPDEGTNKQDESKNGPQNDKDKKVDDKGAPPPSPVTPGNPAPVAAASAPVAAKPLPVREQDSGTTLSSKMVNLRAALDAQQRQPTLTPGAMAAHPPVDVNANSTASASPNTYTPIANNDKQQSQLARQLADAVKAREESKKKEDLRTGGTGPDPKDTDPKSTTRNSPSHHS